VAVGTRQLAARTVEAYRSDWADFEHWCAARKVVPLPASIEVLVAYLDDLSDRRRFSTVRRRLAAIRSAHLEASVPLATNAPELTAALARCHWRDRANGTSTKPLGVSELCAMSRAVGHDASGLRDRALMLVGYGAALRPGDLVALTTTDLTVVRPGLRVRTRRGDLVVPFGSRAELCAVKAWKAWRALLPDDGGPAFRAVDRHQHIAAHGLSEKAVGRIVRRAAAAAELDPTAYSGLSLRRGIVSAAVSNGVSQRGIMHQTGHRSSRLVRGYIAAAEANESAADAP
jgi:site-specific recombinase XerD